MPNIEDIHNYYCISGFPGAPCNEEQYIIYRILATVLWSILSIYSFYILYRTRYTPTDTVTSKRSQQLLYFSFFMIAFIHILQYGISLMNSTPIHSVDLYIIIDCILNTLFVFCINIICYSWTKMYHIINTTHLSDQSHYKIIKILRILWVLSIIIGMSIYSTLRIYYSTQLSISLYYSIQCIYIYVVLLPIALLLYYVYKLRHMLFTALHANIINNDNNNNTTSTQTDHLLDNTDNNTKHTQTRAIAPVVSFADALNTSYHAFSGRGGGGGSSIGRDPSLVYSTKRSNNILTSSLHNSSYVDSNSRQNGMIGNNNNGSTAVPSDPDLSVPPLSATPSIDSINSGTNTAITSITDQLSVNSGYNRHHNDNNNDDIHSLSSQDSTRPIQRLVLSRLGWFACQLSLALILHLIATLSWPYVAIYYTSLVSILLLSSLLPRFRPEYTLWEESNMVSSSKSHNYDDDTLYRVGSFPVGSYLRETTASAYDDTSPRHNTRHYKGNDNDRNKEQYGGPQPSSIVRRNDSDIAWSLHGVASPNGQLNNSIADSNDIKGGHTSTSTPSTTITTDTQRGTTPLPQSAMMYAAQLNNPLNRQTNATPNASNDNTPTQTIAMRGAPSTGPVFSSRPNMNRTLPGGASPANIGGSYVSLGIGSSMVESYTKNEFIQSQPYGFAGLGGTTASGGSFAGTSTTTNGQQKSIKTAGIGPYNTPNNPNNNSNNPGTPRHNTMPPVSSSSSSATPTIAGAATTTTTGGAAVTTVGGSSIGVGSIATSAMPIAMANQGNNPVASNIPRMQQQQQQQQLKGGTTMGTTPHIQNTYGQQHPSTYNPHSTFRQQPAQPQPIIQQPALQRQQSGQLQPTTPGLNRQQSGHGGSSLRVGSVSQQYPQLQKQGSGGIPSSPQTGPRLAAPSTPTRASHQNRGTSQQTPASPQAHMTASSFSQYYSNQRQNVYSPRVQPQQQNTNNTPR